MEQRAQSQVYLNSVESWQKSMTINGKRKLVFILLSESNFAGCWISHRDSADYFIECRENKFVKLCSPFNRQNYNFFLISPKNHSIFMHFWWKWASQKWLIFQQKDIFFSGKWQLFQYKIVSWPARRHIIHLMNNALRIIRYLLYISTLEVKKYVGIYAKSVAVLQCCS